MGHGAAATDTDAVVYNDYHCRRSLDRDGVDGEVDTDTEASGAEAAMDTEWPVPEMVCVAAW